MLNVNRKTTINNNNNNENNKHKQSFLVRRPALYRPLMQECEGCCVHLILVCTRGEGLHSSCHNATQLRQAGRQTGGAHPQKQICCKHDHLGNVNAASFGSFICFVLFPKDVRGHAGTGSALERHTPASSAATAPCEARSSQRTTVRCLKKQLS